MLQCPAPPFNHALQDHARGKWVCARFREVETTMMRITFCFWVSFLGICFQASGQVGIVTTVAGNGNCCFSGDGGPALSASLGLPSAVAVDASGNLFIADLSHRVRRVSASGIISAVAGNGTQGFSGDGGPATAASLNTPGGIAVDGSGNLFIADTGNNRIRKVSAGGVISTVAGRAGGFSGDGGPAASAQLAAPRGVAVDGSGNLFIADTNNSRIRKVTSAGIISTVAGAGNSYTCVPGSCSPAYGDGGPATAAGLLSPYAVTVDASGNLFIADTGNNRIRKVSPSGIITTVAGNGQQSSSGDGGPAIAASLQPNSVTVDAAGNLFVPDYGDNVVRMVAPNGIITTVAGNGKSGFSGDGGPATSASINAVSVALDSSGSLFIADFGNDRIRKSSSSASVVSAATYASGIAVAPNSLIAVFGNGLAASTVQATLDSNGQLPTTLAGTKVQINGQAAGLIFVSSWQINCVVPSNTAVGLATVIVSASGTQVGAGTVSIATTVPGLFSADGSGTGAAAAVNAITYAGPPFPVQTQQNPATDQRTRVSLFGTGIRYAGNPSRDPTITNVASNLAVVAFDASGNGLPVQAEYAGPAPGFVGLDQVNLVLPAQAGSTGNMSIQIYAGTTASNTLLVPILQSAGPVLTSVQPAAVAPGADVVINGTGFIAEDPALPSARNAVFLLLPSGARIPLPVTQTAATSLTAIFLPLQANGSWYAGPAQVCVSVDGQQTCASAPVQIGPLKMLTSAPGSTLLSLQQQSAVALASFFTAQGLPAAAAAIQAGAQTDAANLNAYIAAAVNKKPLTLTLPDGSSITVNPSLAVIATMETLLANSSVANPMSVAAAADAAASGPVSCAAADESAMAAQKSHYALVHPAVEHLVYAAAISTAAANPAICANFSALACAGAELVELLVTALGVEALAADLLTQVSPYWLSDLQVVPACTTGSGGCLTVPLASSGTFSILGDFKPKIALQNGVNVAALQLLNESLAGLVKSALPSLSLATVEQAAAGVLTEVAQKVADDFTANLAGYPPASGIQQVALSSQSLSALPSQDAYVSIKLACGSTAASAAGNQLTPVVGGTAFPSEFSFIVNADRFLLLNTSPGAGLSVSVTNLFAVTPSDNYSVTGQQGGVPASPKIYTLTNLVKSSITYSVSISYQAGASSWLSVSPVSGNLPVNGSAVVTISANSAASGLSPGTYTATITFAGGGSSATRNATLTVTPLGACLDISGPWNGSESGSLTETINATADSGSETDPVNGIGLVTITQNGCSIQYNPIAETGLIGTNLTASQLASLVRTGTVTGTSVHVTGLLALVDTVAASQNGITISNVSQNLMTATGQAVGNVITLKGTGAFSASGTYSISGQSGAFTLTITSSTVATLNRASAAQSSAGSSFMVHLLPEQTNTPRAVLAAIQERIRTALQKALVFGDR
jgi:uncharacterized protein (TIGR03437 family)